MDKEETIKFLKEARDYHLRYKELGFKKYDQDCIPLTESKNDCGCASHTVNCIIGIEKSRIKNMGSCYTEKVSLIIYLE